MLLRKVHGALGVYNLNQSGDSEKTSPKMKRLWCIQGEPWAYFNTSKGELAHGDGRLKYSRNNNRWHMVTKKPGEDKRNPEKRWKDRPW